MPGVFHAARVFLEQRFDFGEARVRGVQRRRDQREKSKHETAQNGFTVIFFRAQTRNFDDMRWNESWTDRLHGACGEAPTKNPDVSSVRHRIRVCRVVVPHTGFAGAHERKSQLTSRVAL